MNVNIVILGINHNDPLGRNKIVAKLEELKNNGFIPDCIAVEWSKNFAQSIIGQRKSFIKYAKDNAPYLNEKTLEGLASALAYEADSHIDLYPNLSIIWLDEGSTYRNPIEFYARDRFIEVYIEVLYKLRKRNINDLNEISKIIWKEGYPHKAEERDKRFYDKTINAIQNGHKNIIAIVGVRHANKSIKGSFVDLLIKKGFNTSVYILKRPLSL